MVCCRKQPQDEDDPGLETGAENDRHGNRDDGKSDARSEASYASIADADLDAALRPSALYTTPPEYAEAYDALWATARAAWRLRHGAYALGPGYVTQYTMSDDPYALGDAQVRLYRVTIGSPCESAGNPVLQTGPDWSGTVLGHEEVTQYVLPEETGEIPDSPELQVHF